MLGSAFCVVEHGVEIPIGEYLASTLAPYGTMMDVDPSQGTTQVPGGPSFMVPATGDAIGMLMQFVFINANGQKVVTNAVGDQTGVAIQYPAGAYMGNSLLGGSLGAIPVPSYFEDVTMGIGNLFAKIGTAVSLLRWDSTAMIAVEGEASKVWNDYTGLSQLLITSGTGQITTSTSLNTELSIFNGRWRAAQNGDVVRGRVKSQLAPVSGSTNVRIRIAGCSGYVKA